MKTITATVLMLMTLGAHAQGGYERITDPALFNCGWTYFDENGNEVELTRIELAQALEAEWFDVSDKLELGMYPKPMVPYYRAAIADYEAGMACLTRTAQQVADDRSATQPTAAPLECPEAEPVECPEAEPVECPEAAQAQCPEQEDGMVAGGDAVLVPREGPLDAPALFAEFYAWVWEPCTMLDAALAVRSTKDQQPFDHRQFRRLTAELIAVTNKQKRTEAARSMIAAGLGEEPWRERAATYKVALLVCAQGAIDHYKP